MKQKRRAAHREATEAVCPLHRTRVPHNSSPACIYVYSDVYICWKHICRKYICRKSHLYILYVYNIIYIITWGCIGTLICICTLSTHICVYLCTYMYFPLIYILCVHTYLHIFSFLFFSVLLEVFIYYVNSCASFYIYIMYTLSTR